jgi:hypothetical protein
MLDTIRLRCIPLVLAIAAIWQTQSNAIAEDPSWRIAKFSGEASLQTGGHRSALGEGMLVGPGQNIQTGPTGRVLLARGQETILISPNSVLGLPAENKSGFSTIILQQAGSILLEVEKRNVKHFAVESPDLAAVVKGTQFRVTVNHSDSRVDVFRGQVEVHDFRSGQYALVLPNQAAMASARQEGAGLFLSGSGALNPIQQGTPRSRSVSPAYPSDEVGERPVRVASAATILPAATWIPPMNPTLRPDWYSQLALYVMSFVRSKSSGHDNHREDSFLAIVVGSSAFFAVATLVALRKRRTDRAAGRQTSSNRA